MLNDAINEDLTDLENQEEKAVKKNAMPRNFDSFADARKQGFINMKKLKDEGAKVVGKFCTYTPSEIILAAGAIDVSLCSTGDETIPDAEEILPKNLCPLIKSSYGFAITDKCPYMYFADLVVGETTCDGKKKMFELLGEIKDVHVMQLPYGQQGRALDSWEHEMYVLKEKLDEKFNVTISEDDLKKAIKDKNKERTALIDFYNMSKLCPPPMWGLSQLQVLFGSQFKFDIDEKTKEIEDKTKEVLAAYEKGERVVPDSAKRILLTGCPTGGVTEKVVKAIEASGGVVVAYENCTGAKQMENLVDENIDPMRAIAERYLAIGCSVMSPDNNRYELLERLCEDFKVDGVVEMTLQACHTYAIETTYVKRKLDKMEIPYINIETDYSTSDIGQITTRMEAFIEMLD